MEEGPEKAQRSLGLLFLPIGLQILLAEIQPY